MSRLADMGFNIPLLQCDRDKFVARIAPHKPEKSGKMTLTSARGHGTVIRVPVTVDQEHSRLAAARSTRAAIRDKVLRRVALAAQEQPAESPARSISPRRSGAHQGYLRRGARCTLREERGDLFEVSTDWALCHCVALDLRMGKGIAVPFEKTFGGVKELHDQNLRVGGVGVLKRQGRCLFYPVTKELYSGKPTI